MNTKKTYKSILNSKSLFISIGIITVVTIFLFNLKLSSKYTITNISPTEEPVIDEFFTKITPTVIPTSNNRNRFIHPQNDFSFEYPAEWKLTLSKHNYSDNWYDVQLSNNDQNKFRIYLAVNGRDYPNYREVTEDKILGNKHVTWTTLYNNDGQAVEAFTGFPDNDFGDKLIGLYIYLPKDNQEIFIKQVEDIIASLK